MSDMKHTTWLVYDHQEHKWLKEFNHPTNYVDEASEFLQEEAEKLVAETAGKSWIADRPPRVMVPDVRGEHADKGLKGQADAVWQLVEAATERMCADATTSSLIDRARAAYEQADAVRDAGYERERAHRIAGIIEALGELGLTPSGQPFTNLASHRVCVPLIDGSWDDESETQIHSVAAEWDDDDDEPGLVLVADLDLGEDWNAKRLYPAGRFDGLVDLGRAIEQGGRTPARPSTPQAVINDLLGKAFGEATVETAAMVRATEALCTALLDVADAIRKTAGA